MTDDTTATPDEPESLDDALAKIDQINELAATDPGSPLAAVALWRAIVTLPAWYIINTGSAEAPSPFAIGAAEGTMVAIYGSAERAKEAAVALELTSEGEAAEAIALNVEASITWLENLAAAGVVGVTFDYPRIGAWTPTSNLALMSRGDSALTTPQLDDSASRETTEP